MSFDIDVIQRALPYLWIGRVGDDAGLGPDHDRPEIDPGFAVFDQ